MTNKIFIVACAVLLLSAVIMFIAAAAPAVSDDAALTSGKVEASEEPVTYTVKACGNKIGIFINGEAEPVKTISIDPKSLPDEAQLLLEQGITVNGHNELLLLIEDYIS